MGEIKFRAWDKEKKMWTNWKCYDNMFYFMDKITSVWIRDDKFNRFSLMQYTGLKDKNGVEIYEGDIVKTCEGKLHQVIWKDNGFKFLYKFNIRGYDEKTILGLRDTSSRRWGVEVIGDIYKNPELLKEGEE